LSYEDEGKESFQTSSLHGYYYTGTEITRGAVVLLWKASLELALSDVSTIVDLPIIPIALGVLAVVAAVTLVGGGGDKEPAPSVPAPVVLETVNLSIPYDVAARLAYDNADNFVMLLMKNNKVLEVGSW
jgi:hypothetical protein